MGIITIYHELKRNWLVIVVLTMVILGSGLTYNILYSQKKFQGVTIVEVATKLDKNGTRMPFDSTTNLVARYKSPFLPLSEVKQECNVNSSHDLKSFFEEALVVSQFKSSSYILITYRDSTSLKVKSCLDYIAKTVVEDQNKKANALMQLYLARIDEVDKQIAHLSSSPSKDNAYSFVWGGLWIDKNESIFNLNAIEKSKILSPTYGHERPINDRRGLLIAQLLFFGLCLSFLIIYVRYLFKK